MLTRDINSPVAVRYSIATVPSVILLPEGKVVNGELNEQQIDELIGDCDESSKA